MTQASIFQRVLEVGPTTRGEGLSMTLLWDGGDRALAIAQFDGQDITTDISRARLLADVKDLQELACKGRLQVVYRSEALIRKLMAA